MTEAGYRVVTFDNRGVAPSSAPPAPYTIDEMVDDTIGLLDHLGLDAVHIAGYSMGGWVAETLAYRRPERVRSAVFIGSCNVGTSWEKAITTVERDLARLDNELPPLVQRGGDHAVPAQPRAAARRRRRPVAVADRRPRAVAQPRPAGPVRGRPGVVARPRADPTLARACPDRAWCSPSSTTSTPRRPGHARPPAMIPGARFVELAGASHLGVFTHADAVSGAVLGFLVRCAAGDAPGERRPSGPAASA